MSVSPTDQGFPIISDLTSTSRPATPPPSSARPAPGKTTLVKLLLRFYDVTGGSLQLDGHDCATSGWPTCAAPSAWSARTSSCSTAPCARTSPTAGPTRPVDEHRGRATVAEAHDFILELPDGYDTIVGERGQKLSGGQRQRLSIARAVLKDPPILILDEATSSVDNETEAAIQRSLERIAVGRTTIVIAHRLSTVRHADRIYVLEDGRLAEDGRHEELLSNAGLYAGLWKVQTGEAIPWHVKGGSD